MLSPIPCCEARDPRGRMDTCACGGGSPTGMIRTGRQNAPSVTSLIAISACLAWACVGTALEWPGFRPEPDADGEEDDETAEATG